MLAKEGVQDERASLLEQAEQSDGTILAAACEDRAEQRESVDLPPTDRLRERPPPGGS